MGGLALSWTVYYGVCQFLVLVVFVGCLIVTFVRLGGLAVVYSCCGCVDYGLDCVICWLVLIVLLWWPVIIVWFAVYLLFVACCIAFTFGRFAVLFGIVGCLLLCGLVCIGCWLVGSVGI